MTYTQKLNTHIVLLLSFILWGCSTTTTKTNIDHPGYIKIIQLYPDLKNTNLMIYYFDGDCSFCIAKLLQIETDLKMKKNYKGVFIAKTEDLLILSYNLKKANIKSLVIVDKENLFNQYFRLNEIIEVKNGAGVIQE